MRGTEKYHKTLHQHFLLYLQEQLPLVTMEEPRNVCQTLACCSRVCKWMKTLPSHLPYINCPL